MSFLIIDGELEMQILNFFWPSMIQSNCPFTHIMGAVHMNTLTYLRDNKKAKEKDMK